MNSDDTLSTGTRHILEAQGINKELIEKTLEMRAMAYIANIKSNLLTDTIFKTDSCKKGLDIAPLDLEKKVDSRTRELQIAVETLKATQEQLRKNNEELETRVNERTAEILKLSHTIEQSPSVVLITDTEGNIEYVNPRFTKITGYTFEDAIGQNPRILKSGKNTDEEYKQLWDTIMSGNEWRGELCNKKKNGELYWESVSISSFKNREGLISSFIAVTEDITERKSAEEKLRYARGYSDSLINSSLDMIISVDKERNIVTFNPAAEKTFGYKKEEVLGKHVGILYGKKPQDLQIYEVAIKSSEYEGEVINRRKDGSEFVSQLSTTVLYDPDGDIIGLMGISRDITERKNNEIKLLAAMEEAKSANEAKSTFLSSMSHEIRTPMNSILGFAQLLISNPQEPLAESQKEKVNHILDSGHLLLKLINEILDLSSIESGKLQISMESVDAASVIDEVIASVDPMGQNHKIHIINSVEHSGQFVMADYTRLKQVLINLLSNAIKYNRVNGTITVWNELTEANKIRIAVEDTGLGIAKERLESLFEPFNRLGAETLNKEGTGIGLTITKRLVELMGGSIHVDSVIGKGTKFYVDLEKAKAPSFKTVNTKDVLDGSKLLEKKEKKTLLYIENNPANLKLVESILKCQPGIDLLSTTQAQVGITIARVQQPDAILMDTNLPGMDGFEALRILKSVDATKEIPVIAISANAMSEDIKRGKACGFVDYITKPININEFLEVIDGI
ncbi:PAS/PAC sensor hybrid histidine kinase [Candidatus Scalindua japonica]|uniref:histidine kinase n=1 Tax=Candidatus Scalindua japonica TaxID=1284222 RepID=A0A286TZ62_9BACT|nr:PAS domain-containing hybrid sensor histidine kinase/response regulator [Candidatus Scalindua japonica]GAX61148.1 PAS/PAC sensor hybrid histidine kinase [Candidatus Scalindua japonica]